MRYRPWSSVTVDRTFSISAGLAASTVTPGRTAPDPSRTTPVMLLCARADAGKRRNEDTTTRAGIQRVFIVALLKKYVRGRLQLAYVGAGFSRPNSISRGRLQPA